MKPFFHIILEASAGTLFGYTMYAYQKAGRGSGVMEEMAIPSGIIAGLIVFGLGHAMTSELMPRNRLKVLIAFNVTLVMMAVLFERS